MIFIDIKVFVPKTFHTGKPRLYVSMTVTNEHKYYVIFFLFNFVPGALKYGVSIQILVAVVRSNQILFVYLVYTNVTKNGED